MLCLNSGKNKLVFSFECDNINSCYHEHIRHVESEQLSSSLWCQNDGMCSFKNLCYHLNFKFLFVLTNQSVLSGIKDKDGLKKIKGSSVIGHNDYLPLSLISANHPILKNILFVNHAAFLLWRFKPDNIMHIIHDDLLPLYLTYSELCSGNISACALFYSLVFIDGHKVGPYLDWYKIFSHLKPFSLPHLSNDTTVCFRSSRTGISTKSIFFQYGFNRPQGPKRSTMTGTLLHQFADFVLKQYKIRPHTIPKVYTLISRRINRKILNEEFIAHKIKHILKQKYNNDITVSKIDVSCNSTYEILSLISSSKLLVGMHGSAMILAIFMPLGTSVIELFPYGINYKNVSPLNAVSHVPGSYFAYWHWTNEEEKYTLPHPEYHSLFGGIHNLHWDKQIKIKNTKLVPAVKCCHNPAYLYRMYQDTVVDNSIVPILEKAIDKTYSFFFYNHYHWKKWFFPAPVTNVSCTFVENNVKISWLEPLNTYSDIVKYKLLLSIKNINYLFHTFNTSIYLNESVCSGGIELWISCSINGIDSVDSYIKCYQSL